MCGYPSVICMGIHYGLQGSLLAYLVWSWETCTALALPFWHQQKGECSGVGTNRHLCEWEMRLSIDP